MNVKHLSWLKLCLVYRLGQHKAKNQRNKKWHRKFLVNLRLEIRQFPFFCIFWAPKPRKKLGDDKKLGDKNIGDVLSMYVLAFLQFPRNSGIEAFVWHFCAKPSTYIGVAIWICESTATDKALLVLFNLQSTIKCGTGVMNIAPSKF